MLRFYFFLTLLFCLLASTPDARADAPVIIAVTDDLPADYRRFLNGRDPMDVKAFNTEGARRDIVELTLLMQALRLGGFQKPVELQVEPGYLRLLRGVADGRFVSSGALVWKSDMDLLSANLYISRPLVNEGEFVVGIYTTKTKTQEFNQLTSAQIKKLKVVTNQQWIADVNTLKNLGFSNITYSSNWVSMAHMLSADRADITLAPFQATEHMSIAVDDVTLYPIHGVKVAISGSRHWPVSRKHPDGNAFYQALEKGLALLQAKGTIARAYRECGFFHPGVSRWPLMTPAAQ